MKRNLFILIIVIIVLGAGFMAFQSTPYRPHNYEPVMMSRVDLEASFAVLPAREIEAPGKLWVFNNYILLVEQYKGIHVIDNTNPNDPQRVLFINVEGCTELAARDGILYVNNAVDLIGMKANVSFSTFDLVSRNRNVMPSISSPDPWSDWYFTSKLPDDMIIVRWEPLDE